jgi:hypothetical protein
MVKNKERTQQMDEELGYTRYDYKEKEGTNSRNGHHRKTLKTENPWIYCLRQPETRCLPIIILSLRSRMNAFLRLKPPKEPGLTPVILWRCGYPETEVR